MLALTTIFTTTKSALAFTKREDFNLKAIHAVIDNYATATVLNTKDLFVGALCPVSSIRIVTVEGEDFSPTHIGIAFLSWKDDEDKTHDITITDTLCFPTLLVNVVSILQLSLQHSNSNLNCDQRTLIKTTHRTL